MDGHPIERRMRLAPAPWLLLAGTVALFLLDASSRCRTQSDQALSVTLGPSAAVYDAPLQTAYPATYTIALRFSWPEEAAGFGRFVDGVTDALRTDALAGQPEWAWEVLDGDALVAQGPRGDLRSGPRIPEHRHVFGDAHVDSWGDGRALAIGTIDGRPGRRLRMRFVVGAAHEALLRTGAHLVVWRAVHDLPPLLPHGGRPLVAGSYWHLFSAEARNQR